MDIENRVDKIEGRQQDSDIKITGLSAQLTALSDTTNLNLSHIKELIEKSVIPKIDEVKAQALKTNGRVDRLEGESDTTRTHIAACPLPSVAKEVEGLKKRQDNLERTTEISRAITNNPFIFKVVGIGTVVIALGIILGLGILIF